jgi:ribosomal protein S18 acetylase RimI-like enzyme
MSIQYDGSDSQGNSVYILIENGKKTGSLSVNLGFCSIMNILVEKELRKEGRGKKLVYFAESLAIKKGCVVMRTSPINPEARGFFERCGYKIDSEEHGSKTIQFEW